MFRRGQGDIETVCDKNELSRIFRDGKNKDKCKYEQYIAIPVLCDSKMVGLLQVICIEGAVIGEGKKEMKEFAGKYLMPFTNLVLLLHKIDKSLLLKTDNYNIEMECYNEKIQFKKS